MERTERNRAESTLRQRMGGAATHAEACRRLGGREELRRALSTGTLVNLWPGVVVLAEEVDDPATRARAALLRAGPEAVLSGLTALAVHGCRAALSRVTYVTVPYHRQVRRAPGLVVRQNGVREGEVVELDGLPTQVLDLALTEVLCTAEEQRAVSCLRQVASLPSGTEGLWALVEQRLRVRRDRRGTRRARALLRTVPGVLRRHARPAEHPDSSR
ncbi:hypothetical protein [Actinopolyspora mortivallis]|uniref:AbiEi antitoxin C-terminal domain-containing protein n=1 Tax=Actinopolyspora mortivallis TaxID=33906 RepID=A0A2T0GTK7_ACTMO|nr:hypothetical protein [Actinopolyspora mortivallis]PRW62430.1 hypothetical protein CEP50_15435 [Actinopolyspora mortivallis]